MGSSSPYQLAGLLFAKPYLGCCSLLWELVGRESCPGLLAAGRGQACGYLSAALLDAPRAPGSSSGRWILSHPKEEAAEMKWPHSDGTLGLETQFNKRLSSPAWQAGFFFTSLDASNLFKPCS